MASNDRDRESIASDGDGINAHGSLGWSTAQQSRKRPKTSFSHNVPPHNIIYDSVQNLLRTNDSIITSPAPDWAEAKREVDAWCATIRRQLAARAISEESKVVLKTSIEFINNNPPPECPIKFFKIPTVEPFAESYQKYHDQRGKDWNNSYEAQLNRRALRNFTRTYGASTSNFTNRSGNACSHVNSYCACSKPINSHDACSTTCGLAQPPKPQQPQQQYPYCHSHNVPPQTPYGSPAEAYHHESPQIGSGAAFEGPQLSNVSNGRGPYECCPRNSPQSESSPSGGVTNRDNSFGGPQGEQRNSSYHRST